MGSRPATSPVRSSSPSSCLESLLLLFGCLRIAATRVATIAIAIHHTARPAPWTGSRSRGPPRLQLPRCVKIWRRPPRWGRRAPIWWPATWIGEGAARCPAVAAGGVSPCLCVWWASRRRSPRPPPRRASRRTRFTTAWWSGLGFRASALRKLLPQGSVRQLPYLFTYRKRRNVHMSVEFRFFFFCVGCYMCRPRVSLQHGILKRYSGWSPKIKHLEGYICTRWEYFVARSSTWILVHGRRLCPKVGNNEVFATESLPRGTDYLPIALLNCIDTGQASLKTGFGNMNGGTFIQLLWVQMRI